MRVNCYNATECPLSEIFVGDTFYLNSTLCIKVLPDNVDVFATQQDRCFVVELEKGILKSVKADAPVIKAETEVVTHYDTCEATPEF